MIYELIYLLDVSRVIILVGSQTAGFGDSWSDDETSHQHVLTPQYI